MTNIVYNRDCLEAMREMPDKAFDLAIVDPPYGINRDGSSRIAADKFGCSFTGFEIDKDYFEAQEQRFRQYKSQLTLF